VWETDRPSHSEPVNITDERKRIKELLVDQEREEILALLYKNKGNIAKVAREIGISRNSIYRKLNKLNITP
jgi:transcriptional regulator of acetoin/glycerol metabolism